MEKLAAFITVFGLAWAIFAWLFPYTAEQIAKWFNDIPNAIKRFFVSMTTTRKEDQTDEESDDDSDSDEKQ